MYKFFLPLLAAYLCLIFNDAGDGLKFPKPFFSVLAVETGTVMHIMSGFLGNNRNAFVGMAEGFLYSPGFPQVLHLAQSCSSLGEFVNQDETCHSSLPPLCISGSNSGC